MNGDVGIKHVKIVETRSALSNDTSTIMRNPSLHNMFRQKVTHDYTIANILDSISKQTSCSHYSLRGSSVYTSPFILLNDLCTCVILLFQSVSFSPYIKIMCVDVSGHFHYETEAHFL